MKLTKTEVNDAIEDTLNQLIENAEALAEISDDPNYYFEKRALEDIQESLLAKLTGFEKVKDKPSCLLRSKMKRFAELDENICNKQMQKLNGNSNFRKKSFIRKSRKKLNP